MKKHLWLFRQLVVLQTYLSKRVILQKMEIIIILKLISGISKIHQNVIDELFNNHDNEQVKTFVAKKLDHLKGYSG